MLRALAEHSSRRRNSTALGIFINSLLSSSKTSPMASSCFPSSSSASASASASALAAATAKAGAPRAATRTPASARALSPLVSGSSLVPRRPLSTTTATYASSASSSARRTSNGGEPHLSLRSDIARVVAVVPVPSPSSSARGASFQRSPRTKTSTVAAAASASSAPPTGHGRREEQEEEEGVERLLLLSPETPLAEALLRVSSPSSSSSSSSSPPPSLSASEEFAVDRLRARGVETAGELFELVRGELSSYASSSSRSRGSSTKKKNNGEEEEEKEKEAAATAVVAASTRLPPSVVAAVCAGVEEAAARGELRRRRGIGGSPVSSSTMPVATEVVAEIPRTTRKRRSAPSSSSSSSTPTTKKKTEKNEQQQQQQTRNNNNVLEFRQSPSPSLTGCAAASASRVLRAPPTDPRWTAGGPLASGGRRGGGGGGGGGALFPSGERPPFVDDAVRAVLTRRAPQADRYFHGDPNDVKVTSKGKKGKGTTTKKTATSRSDSPSSSSSSNSKDSYALHPRDTPRRLREELDDFYRFWTVRFPGQQQQPVAAVTAEKYVDHLRRMLGWALAQGKVRRTRRSGGDDDDDDDGRGHGEGRQTPSSSSSSSSPSSSSSSSSSFSPPSPPPEDLSLRDLIPSPKREGSALAMEYAAWLARHRGVTPHTEGLAVRSLLSAAKFLYHDVSRARVASGERPYSDLEVVTELRAMSREAREAGKRAPSVADEAAKWLDWPDYLAVVEELRRECGALNERGKRRSDAAVAWSLQRYLMFAILACVPDRQRTLRELEVGRTLFYENGKWVIRHGAGDYKTGKIYGTRPPLQLDESLYPELHAFLSTWRACLNPRHDFVFTKKTGEPMTTQAVHKLFNMAAFRLSGKKLNPHLVRGMVITHLRRRGDATEAELESLAFLMGHSLAMQRSTYDKRSAADKVEPAVGLLQRLNNSDNSDAGSSGGKGL